MEAGAPHAAAACSASPPRSRSGLSATGPPAHVPARRLSRQRPLAPRGPGPVDAAGREVELAGRQLLYPERVHEGGGVLPEGHPQHARRRQEPERPLGSEFTCDMSSAQSAAVSRSNLAPAPLGSSFLISTWFFSHAPFCWLCRGSQ